MATAYPTGLDNFANPAATDALTGHAGKHTDLNDAVEAIEAKVGVNGSAVATSLDAKVAKLEKLGTLGYAQVTANQGPPITTEVDLTGLAVTVTVAAGRRIKITGYIGGASSASDDVLQLAVKEGATQLNRANKGVRGGNTVHWSVIWSGTPTAGAHTYKLTLARVVGTGSANLTAGPTEPAFILVEDIGPA